MEYTFETLYNQDALTIMAKCLRKTGGERLQRGCEKHCGNDLSV